MKNTDVESIRGLEKLPLAEAKEVVKSWLVPPKKGSTFKYRHLLLDVQNSPSIESLVKTVWNIVLAGDGYAVPSSQWQKDHAKHLYS